MGCKTKLKVNGNIKSREAWSDLSVAVGYYLERGERSMTALHEKVKQHFPDVDESHVAIAAKEVVDEVYLRVPSVSTKKATLATLNAEIKRLTDPTAIERATDAIKKLESEDTSKFTPDQWRQRYAEIIGEARRLNRGARIDENFFVEREAAFSDPEVRKVRQQLNVIKKEADAFITAAERSNRSLLIKTKDVIADVAGAPRSLKSSFDLSTAGRQGWLLVLANPKLSKNAFRSQLKSLSEKGAAQIELDLQEHPRYTEAKSDGVLRLGGIEEAFPSSIAERLPGVKQTSRAHSAFLHQQRLDMYGHMASSIENSTGVPLTKKERMALANHVNVASGSGNINFLSPEGVVIAGKMFFSARLAASRIEYLTLATLRNPDASPRVKRAIAENYARTVAGFSATVLAASLVGARLNTDDPTEHNFLKVTLGNTDFDLTAGLSKYIVAAARATDQNSNAFTKGDQFVRLLRGLLSPSAGLASDAILNNGKFYYRRDSEGKQVLIWDDTSDATRLRSAQRLALEMLAPIGVGNVIEQAEKGRPPQEITRNALIEALGIGVTNREDRPTTSSKK